MFVLRFLCFVFILVTCESAKILAVFPTPSYSHHVVFRQFTVGLANRGHEVVVITPYPSFSKEIPRVTEIDVYDASVKVKNYVIKEFAKANDIMSFNKLCLNLHGRLLDAQFSTEDVRRLLKDKRNKFDLIIGEAHIRPLVALSHVLNAPVILMSAFGGTFAMFDSVGAATHPIMFPTENGQGFHNLTLWEKLIEIYNYYSWIRENYRVEEIENEIIKKHFGPDVPHVSELKKNVVMLLLNVHPLWDSNRPVPPNVIYLGMISSKPQGNLSQELQSYLDNSLNDIVYVSFGTNVDKSLITSEKLMMILEVFSRLPYNFLMKWDEEITGLSKNIRMSKWFPQVDVLRHPKVKLFITHGGLQSVYEGIAAEVPMIGIPIMFDQHLNVDKLREFEIGEQLNIHLINNDILKNSIEKVMNHESNRQNIAKLRRLMFDQTEQPIERAIWWTEYVLRHGRETKFGPPSANISWLEYYEVKLVCLVVVTVSTIAIVILKCLRWLLRFIFFAKKKTD